MTSRSVRCPVASTLDLVGDRWTLLIVRDLLKGDARFTDLRRSVEGITSSVLSARLKVLESEELVERRFYTDHPPRAEYLLTAKGHSLGVVVGALASWGRAPHRPRPLDRRPPLRARRRRGLPLSHLRPRRPPLPDPDRPRLRGS